MNTPPSTGGFFIGEDGHRKSHESIISNYEAAYSKELRAKLDEMVVRVFGEQQTKIEHVMMCGVILLNYIDSINKKGGNAKLQPKDTSGLGMDGIAPSHFRMHNPSSSNDVTD